MHIPSKEKFVHTPKDKAFYKHLDNPQVVRDLQYRFEGIPLIYGITCMVNQMIYIGSSLSPSKRFHKHLTIRSTDSSNKDKRL